MQKRKRKNIIFITSDTKEDWFESRKGETKRPRPELITEFHNETNQLIYIYTVKNFLGYAKKQFDIDSIDEAVLGELTEMGRNRHINQLKMEKEGIAEIDKLSFEARSRWARALEIGEMTEEDYLAELNKVKYKEILENREEYNERMRFIKEMINKKK